MKRLLLLLLLCGVVWADDRADITALVKRWGTLHDLRQAGDWALVEWRHPEAEGEALLRRVDGRWWVLTGGGGAMDGGNLWQLGVPEGVITKFGRSGPRPAGPYWTWITRERDVTDELLESYSAYELTLMRNEVFAVHGRIFKDPVLGAYFRSRAYYRPNPAYSEALLSAREKRNVAAIMAYQKRKGLVF